MDIFPNVIQDIINNYIGKPFTIYMVFSNYLKTYKELFINLINKDRYSVKTKNIFSFYLNISFFSKNNLEKYIKDYLATTSKYVSIIRFCFLDTNKPNYNNLIEQKLLKYDFVHSFFDDKDNSRELICHKTINLLNIFLEKQLSL